MPQYIFTELTPDLVFTHTDHKHAVLGVISAVGAVGGMLVAGATNHFAVYEIAVVFGWLEGNDGLYQTGLDLLTVTDNGSGMEGCQNADDHIHTGSHIPDGGRHLHRLAALFVDAEHDTAHGLRDHVISGALGVRAGSTEAGNGGIDDLIVDLFQILVAQPQPVHHVGTEVFQYHVRLLYQRAENFFALFTFQIQSDAPLVAVEGGVEGTAAVGIERGIATGLVTALGNFNFDHIGTHFAQPGAGKGAGEHTGHVQDGNVTEGTAKLLFHSFPP